MVEMGLQEEKRETPGWQVQGRRGRRRPKESWVRTMKLERNVGTIWGS